jgi:GNAT superfamily N-acetyltransferase
MSLNTCQVTLSVKPVAPETIAVWRDLYRQEMDCQIIHDSIHSRPGWTVEYALHCDGVAVGYGSVAVGGPWKASPTIYEFYVLPSRRSRFFDLFLAMVERSRAAAIETQSNDPLLTVLLHTFAKNVVSESILFRDNETTAHAPPESAIFRRATPDDAPEVRAGELDPDAAWVVQCDGAVAAAGDILYHYNRPYGDIYMKVAEQFRRRGLGAYLVQELKRVCYAGSSVPAARCNPNNTASRKTLQKAGFFPCGHILTGAFDAPVIGSISRS